jgi:hypothetical protein
MEKQFTKTRLAKMAKQSRTKLPSLTRAKERWEHGQIQQASSHLPTPTHARAR